MGSDAVGSHPGFFAEIGPTPRRDRSYSASRSVEFRVEIGPVPARDRSSSVSRSVRGCDPMSLCDDGVILAVIE